MNKAHGRQPMNTSGGKGYWTCSDCPVVRFIGKRRQAPPTDRNSSSRRQVSICLPVLYVWVVNQYSLWQLRARQRMLSYSFTASNVHKYKNGTSDMQISSVPIYRRRYLMNITDNHFTWLMPCPMVAYPLLLLLLLQQSSTPQPSHPNWKCRGRGKGIQLWTLNAFLQCIIIYWNFRRIIKNCA